VCSVESLPDILFSLNRMAFNNVSFSLKHCSHNLSSQARNLTPNVVNCVSRSHKTANIFFSFDSVTVTVLLTGMHT